MAFPDNAIADNFNRVPAVTLGGDWVAYVYQSEDVEFGVESNHAVNPELAQSFATFSSYWFLESMDDSAIMQCSVDIYSKGAASGCHVGVGIVEQLAAGTINADGYEFVDRYLSTATLSRVENGVRTQLGSGFNISADGIGIEFDNSSGTVRAYENSGGTWTTNEERIDATPIDIPFGYGYIYGRATLGNFVYVDDFRVGPGTPAVPPQYARPVATVSAGSWTVSGAPTLHEALDETSASATDYIESPDATAGGHECKIRLGPLTDPAVGTGHEIEYQYKKNILSGDPVNLIVNLYRADGTTLVATQTKTGIGAVTNGTLTLSTTEADSIPSADYATGLVIGFKEVKA